MIAPSTQGDDMKDMILDTLLQVTIGVGVAAALVAWWSA
jgi:hypothetical protein